MPDSPRGEPFVTVAEAARLLGIAPRQARRYAAKLRPEDRDTGTGQGEGRSPLRVRFAALAALREASMAELRDKDSHEDGDRDTQGTVLPGVPPMAPREAAALVQVRAAYEALLREKDARIADLSAALEHERRSHERTQTLIALAAPQEAAPQQPAASDAAGTAGQEEAGKQSKRRWWPFRRG